MDLIRHSLYTMGEDVHAASWVGISNLRGFREGVFKSSTKICVRYHAHVGECFVINSQNTCDEALVDDLHDSSYQERWIELRADGQLSSPQVVKSSKDHSLTRRGSS